MKVINNNYLQLTVLIQNFCVFFAFLRIVMMRNLRDSGLVHIAASEENPVETECGGTGFSVAFDPLDGSSIVDANFAVGTITLVSLEHS